MGYEPPFERTSEIDNLCMEIAELVGTAGGVISTNTLFRYVPYADGGESGSCGLIKTESGLHNTEKLVISGYGS